jgi:hypothetical protein
MSDFMQIETLAKLHIQELALKLERENEHDQ